MPTQQGDRHKITRDSRPSNHTKRWIKQLKEYPDHIRVRGSVLPSILPLIVLTALYSYIIAVVYISWGWTKIALSNSVVPVLSVVLGLLLAFRANTSYARYYEGRQLWQDLSANTRNLARLIWVSIPERTQNDHLEKMRCMKLLLAFAVATKHYLRRELGIDYYDLDYLLPPNWVPAAADDQEQSFAIKDSFGNADIVLESDNNNNNNNNSNGNGAVEVSASNNTEGNNKTNMLDENHGGDDVNDLGNQKCPSVSSVATSTLEGTVPDITNGGGSATATVTVVGSKTSTSTSTTTNNEHGGENSGAVITAEAGTAFPKQQQAKVETKRKKRFVSKEDLPDEGNADMSLPLEIIFRMSLYMAQAQTAGKIDGAFSNVIITHLNNMNDSLAGMERIVNTPIPAVYVIHLKQSLALYLLATPFTLISEIRWWIVPLMILASFTLFGIDAIGAQIDNPFGYNSNDLPLNTFCDLLRKEIEFIVYHLPCETDNAMMI